MNNVQNLCSVAMDGANSRRRGRPRKEQGEEKVKYRTGPASLMIRELWPWRNAPFGLKVIHTQYPDIVHPWDRGVVDQELDIDLLLAHD
ncbi:hypothetical protein HPB49_019022 [Dermacentor silvarum]|uniref:Uncharacterized protein n=1 Tax=Dermacentor silvarum TaxID=543639 RepID=A0ACB8CH04_DERSI|nr:hypothetical protein HPB49_019022 [Dermacentor silvarum]